MQENKPGIVQPTDQNSSKDAMSSGSTALIVIGFFAFFFFLIWLIIRSNDRRRFGSSRTIVAEFAPPPGLNPMMSGLLQDGTFDDSDLLGGVVSLEERGIVSIVPEGRDYKITLTKDPGEVTDTSDRLLLGVLFGEQPTIGAAENLSVLKEIGIVGGQDKADWLKILSPFSLVRKQKGRELYEHLASTLESLGLVNRIKGSIIPIPLIIKRTQKGDMVRDQILGFARYLDTVYGPKYEAHPIPTEESKYIADFLPYAIALGIAKDFWFSARIIPTKTDRANFATYQAPTENIFEIYKKYYK